MTTLTLTSTNKEIDCLLDGKTSIITREIRPRTAKKYVLLNNELECEGVINYDRIKLISTDTILEASIKKIMLMEIVDEKGELIYYDYKGKKYQQVDIDYHIDEIIDIR